MIPEIKMPSIKQFEIENLDEPIVSLSEYGLKVKSMYYKDGIPGSYKDCYARKTVAEKLVKVNKNLPNNLRLLIYDGYRPICIQQRLWNFYRREVENKNKGLSSEEIDFKTSFFVSKPSYDEFLPSLHNTGGAIDLALIDEFDEELNMGTKFDDFSDRAWTNHFEKYEEDIEVRDNRRILYEAMLEEDFTNLPSEWWHYDYGTKFWGYFKNRKALYKGILDIDFPNRFPLI